jgi:hypothetical protein
MASSISTTHPQYSLFLEDWCLMRDAYKGERHVKLQGVKYLSPTDSQVQDGHGTKSNSVGQRSYDAYRRRARFPNFTREAVQMAIGMMHSQPPEIKLPKAMESIRSNKGENLSDLLRRINVEQLITGRLGLMVDLPTNPPSGEDLPYLAVYHTERLINWDDGASEEVIPQVLNLVVLDESEFERSSVFDWKKTDKYRVLVMGDAAENEERGVYRQGVFTDSGFAEAGLSIPSWRGRTLDSIPFTIVNSCDIQADPDEPPLLDLGNICMAIYRGEADYRQNLFMQGQDTLVTTGGNFDSDDDVRTGTGARIDLPLGADAKYIGVESNGLEEQRVAIGNLEARASSMGAQTLDTTSRERESGDSLRIRIAARTADMNQIAETGAGALEQALKSAAEWIGENPDEVSVKPNKEFGEMPLTGQSMVEMATARNAGWPISARSLHELSRKRRITTKTFEEEEAEAKAEKDSVFKPALTADSAGSATQNKVPAEDGGASR